MLAARLCDKGMSNVEVRDVSNTHVSYLISSAFKLSNIALLSVTYNNNLFPNMANFVDDMARLGLKNRKFAVVENGTWAPQAGSVIVKHLEEMNGMTLIDDKAIEGTAIVSFPCADKVDRNDVSFYAAGSGRRRIFATCAAWSCCRCGFL